MVILWPMKYSLILQLTLSRWMKLFRYNKFIHQLSLHADVSASIYQSGPAPKNGLKFATISTQNMKQGVNLNWKIHYPSWNNIFFKKKILDRKYSIVLWLGFVCKQGRGERVRIGGYHVILTNFYDEVPSFQSTHGAKIFSESYFLRNYWYTRFFFIRI